MGAVNTISVRLNVITKGLSQGFKRADGIVAGFSKKLMGLGPMALGALGVAGIGAGIVKLTSMAAAAEELDSKFRVVFGDKAAEVEDWAKRYSGAMGRSIHETKGMLSGMQDLLVPMGFTGDAATKMSQRMVALANDLGSFNNIKAEDVMGDLQSALTGSSEVMKKYGVIANETAVKAELVKQGLDPKNATEQHKALARLSIIMQGTTAAHGDLARTQDSATNTWASLTSKLYDFGVQVGSIFLPAATEIMSAFNDIFGMVGNNEAGFASLGETIASWAKTIADWIRSIAFTFINWDLTAQRIGISMAEFFSGIAGRAEWLWDNLVIGVEFVVDNWQEMFSNAFHNMFTTTKNFGSIIKTFFTGLWDVIASGGKKAMPDFGDEMAKLAKNYKTLQNKPEFKEFRPLDFTDQYNEVDKELQRRWDEWQKGPDEDPTLTPELDVAGLFAELETKASKDAKAKGKGASKEPDGPELASRGSVKAMEISQRLRKAENDPMTKEQKKTNELLAQVKKAAVDTAKALGGGFALLPANLG